MRQPHEKTCLRVVVSFQQCHYKRKTKVFLLHQPISNAAISPISFKSFLTFSNHKLCTLKRPRLVNFDLIRLGEILRREFVVHVSGVGVS